MDNEQGKSSSATPEITLPPSPDVLKEATSNSAEERQAAAPPQNIPDLQKPVVNEQQDRSELLARARLFLISPQVQSQDAFAKRTFLIEKGLNDAEIEDLLRTLPPQVPTIPPRTYPQPPRSNLPELLLGLTRLFSWLAGGSAFLLFMYHRFLLPRITQTSLARQLLKSHHLSLLQRLTTSLTSLNEAQSEYFSIFPQPDPFKEPKQYSECESVADVLKVINAGEKGADPDYLSLPLVSLLRCGIADIGKGEERNNSKPTTKEVFQYLEGQIPWLVTDEGLKYEQKLWETLSTCQLFVKSAGSPSSSNTAEESAESTPECLWEFIPPAPVALPPLLESFHNLSSAMPKETRDKKSLFQYTLQSLSDFTGYISTQIYLPYRPPPMGRGLPNSGSQNTLEEELRREIRALKGLVLNRRSFMPSIPRPITSSTTNHITSIP